MSISMDQGADALLQAAREGAALEELSDVDVDGDGSSSLSEIDDKDGDQDEEADGSDDLSNVSDDDNDSEAETERLEESPNKFRQHKDVVLSSRHESHNYDRTPSKLHNQITVDDQEEEEEEEDEEPLSDADVSNESPESPKSSVHDGAGPDHPTAPTSLEDSSVESKNNLLSAIEADTRKRKRSIMAGSGLEEDLGEPLRKRTGSVMTPVDDYAVGEEPQVDEDLDTSNPISGNISGDEGGVIQEDEVAEEAEEPAAAEDEPQDTADIPVSPKKRGRKKKKAVENGVGTHIEDSEPLPDGEAASNGDDDVRNGENDNADNEGDDEAEAALKNEEELERKRIALDKLGSIERQFSTFRDRLYEQRLEQLNREEAMLRQAKPTHPEYLAMIHCIDTRRDDRVRIADNLKELELQTLKRSAVARRSQILSQFQQEVRDIREKTLEQLGKQWYEIQHDRRSYAGSVPDYSLKFPTRRSQHVVNQVAYSNEVSILSGVAKYIGFPAAPGMAPATAAELEEDLEKMGRTKQARHLPLQELAALRTAGSTSRFKPAEEQFIEQTPWANPQHPSHAHLLQRQTSAQQTPRTSSPFSQVQTQQRRHSHQPPPGLPLSGTFSNTASSLLKHPKGLPTSGGRISPHNPFGNSTLSHSVAPSPLGSRQPSLSPQQNHHPLSLPEQHSTPKPLDAPKSNGLQNSPPAPLTDIPRGFPQDTRREQAAVIIGRY